ncbi:MAG: hypothetical protein JO108_21265 [Acidobacteriaceae bacterium]|nr:hypothetical protein [Acidobacteriaceae bacterium]
MIEHGHEEYLHTYILRDAALLDVPLDGIRNLLALARGDEERSALLQRAIQSWRAREEDGFENGSRAHFFHLFDTGGGFCRERKLRPHSRKSSAPCCKKKM